MNGPISRLESRLFEPPDAFCMCQDECRDWVEHKEKMDSFESKIADEAWESEKEARHGV